MTDKEALLEAIEALHYCEALNRDVDERKMQAITVIRKLWTEHAMRETQRLGQEIEQEPVAHWSDCAVHSEPAYPKGECDCGGIVAVADYTALADKYVALSDKYVALKEQHKEQEPVAWMWRCKPYCDWPNWEVSLKRPADSGCYGDKRTEGYEDVPLYTTPPQRKPLTNGEIYTAYITATNQTLRATDERLAFAFARAIEAAHDIKE